MMESIVCFENEFQELFDLISERRARASQAVNNEVLLSAWEVGAYVSERLKSARWGSKTVTQLSEYLRAHDPSMRGFSRSSIYNMVMLYDYYTSSDFLSYCKDYEAKTLDSQIIQPLAGQLNETLIVQPLAGQFEAQKASAIQSFLTLTSFTNHIEILNRCKRVEERFFYVIYAAKEHLNKRELQRCIDTHTFEALAGNQASISKVLAETYPQTAMLFKDEVFVDFLDLPKKHSEKMLRNKLVENMKSFILEIGKDFIFMDQEYTLNVGGTKYKADLLFYHRALQCLVAVELKSRSFRPQDLGQLEFYLEALDRDIKRSNENPSIGILLCRDANKTVVEYALSRSMSPTMIAKYKQELIPKEVLRKTLDEFGLFLSGSNGGDGE
ncbi:MAG: PDDEXK nuclease domain-containing protein [Lachnospiraceae bacterium]|jgi:predicted nuclease of restriction endonuclease-like (RecB) superfamily|nr:PDDEXK nuclease domain-containing protein [Lachnospiraceae bacterium]